MLVWDTKSLVLFLTGMHTMQLPDPRATQMLKQRMAAVSQLYPRQLGRKFPNRAVSLPFSLNFPRVCKAANT